MFVQPKSGSSLSTLVSIVFALTVVCGLFYSYLYLRNKHAGRNAVASKISTKPGQTTGVIATATQARVAQDETWVKNGQAIIGGTVRNISHNKLSNLLIELEMKKRADGKTENLSIEVAPKNLEPEEQGKFFLSVSSRDYSGLRILHLKDEVSSTDIAFTSVPGQARPVEKAPETKTIIVQKPASRIRGDEFLNTPDNPEVIR